MCNLVSIGAEVCLCLALAGPGGPRLGIALHIFRASVDHTTKIEKSFLGNRKDGTQVAYFIDIVAEPGANASITVTQHL